MQIFESFIRNGKRVFIFLGEAGSGKSEIAVNFALMLVSEGKKVRFFDMDQTKPVFRSRELADLMQERGIIVEYTEQLLDTPTVTGAVLEKVKEPDFFSILDIGGNVTGAITLGQFADSWSLGVKPFLVLNPYRPFSGSEENSLVTMSNIITAARLENINVISNPNFGEQTTLDDVVGGYNSIKDLLKGTQYRTNLLVVPKVLENHARNIFPDADITGITRYMKAAWEDNNIF
jgi:hypothetical protein